MNRRDIMLIGAAGLAVSFVPVTLSASEKETLAQVFAGQKINQGRVSLTTPALAENGNSVAFSIAVDSPMTATDYCEEIILFADLNPVPKIVRYRLSPAAGKASISSRMRFSNSQQVTAVAKMSDGSLWQGTSTTIVTLAACVEPLL